MQSSIEHAVDGRSTPSVFLRPSPRVRTRSIAIDHRRRHVTAVTRRRLPFRTVNGRSENATLKSEMNNSDGDNHSAFTPFVGRLQGHPA